MKTILMFFVQIGLNISVAQVPPTANNIVEGGKVLVELVKVFKKNSLAQGTRSTDNASSDLCFKNNTIDNLYIEFSKRVNDSTMKTLPFSISVTVNAHECLLELSPSLYHYKVFKKNYTGQVLSLEGDIRLVPNEKMEREIR